MTLPWRRWMFPCGIVLATCFGVFVLPFLLPPPVLQGVSVANAAGFNNKVAAVVAALLGMAVFLYKLREPRSVAADLKSDCRLLEMRLVAGVVLATMAVYGSLSWLVLISHQRYLGDAGYFIEQIGAHADYGRRLYDEIEFPYGPLLFYAPIAMRALLSPLHVSLSGAYFVTMLLAHSVGMLAVAYTLNHLPVPYRWRWLLFLLCVPLVFELNFGLNYTFFRFGTSLALLVWSSSCQRAETAAAGLIAGEFVSLGVSPEMGFAFLAGGLVYAGYMLVTHGRRWLFAVAALPVAVMLFLLVAGGGYLRMLALFARGLFNFIVEPLPHILIFLVALVWLVPAALAAYFRAQHEVAPRLAALYIFGLALLPVAFGRADPGHVTFNGLVILFLSTTAIVLYGRTTQWMWAAALSFLFLWTAYIDALMPCQLELRGVIHYDVLHYGSPYLQNAALKITQRLSPAAAQHFMTVTYIEDKSFDITKLQEVIGLDPIATPVEISLAVEQALKTSDQYTPQFYCFATGVLDAVAEERKIVEFNKSRWALIPLGADPVLTETQASAGVDLGFALPYRTRHEPYKVGLRFRDNLQKSWRPYASLGAYEVYQRR